MRRRNQLVFLLLILAQAAHSVEEYSMRLYDVFAPARFVSKLFSSNLTVGFLIFNALLVAFGLWCWALPVRHRWRSARVFCWFWIVLELGNGLGHSVIALDQRAYFPGVGTAPLLLLFAIWLAIEVREPQPGAPGGSPAGKPRPPA